MNAPTYELVSNDVPLAGPYRCPDCHGTVMLDPAKTDDVLFCPYCLAGLNIQPAPIAPTMGHRPDDSPAGTQITGATAAGVALPPCCMGAVTP